MAEGPFELYDLSLDKEQTTNLASKHTKVVEALKSSLINWNQGLSAPGWLDQGESSYLRAIYGEEGMGQYPGLNYKAIGSDEKPPKASNKDRKNSKETPAG